MRTPHTKRPRRAAAVPGLTAAFALLVAGCSTDVSTGFLPSEAGVTDRTGGIISFWNGSWIAALSIGVLVWGLLIWAIIVYRKRKDDDALPVQLQYHVPLELMYTVIPIVLVSVLFVFSQRTIADVQDVSAEPDVTIEVYGKQWSWDFNYVDAGVYYSGERFQLTGTEGDAENLPVLYLPVDQNVQFELHSRDVIHAFWIPAFLYKTDMIPGRTNVFQVTPGEEGSYFGKCAEMCGEFHSEMLFRVEVVSQEEFDAQMEALREAGNEGVLGPELNRWGNTNGGNS
ncbi:MAG TPA: cytochrome c oxidase subunit II [Actinomycetaceae bacterium]|nr:cytochrome c oxidase subunit II [Actinomycetaceae bacterium]